MRVWIAATVLTLAATAACKKTSCPPAAPPPAPAGVTATVVGQSPSGITLTAGDRAVWLPLIALPPGTTACTAGKCSDTSGKELTTLPAPAGERPKGVDPGDEIGAGVVVVSQDRYALVMSRGKGVVVVALARDTAAKSGGQDTTVADVLAAPGGGGGCPCELPRCLPYCKLAGDALGW